MRTQAVDAFRIMRVHYWNFAPLSLDLEQFTYCCERYSLVEVGFLQSKYVPRGHKSA